MSQVGLLWSTNLPLRIAEGFMVNLHEHLKLGDRVSPRHGEIDDLR